MKKSEREVIQDWLENIFKTWEKTNDLEVTLFKFTPLKRGDANLVSKNCERKRESKRESEKLKQSERGRRRRRGYFQVKNGGPGLQMIQGTEGVEGAGEPPLVGNTLGFYPFYLKQVYLPFNS